MSDPHVAENDPEASTADVLYAALHRIVKEVEDGYWPSIGSHGQAYRAMRRFQNEQTGRRPGGCGEGKC